MAAARRKTSRGNRGATRGRSGAPGWIWLLVGLLVGLGLAWYLFARGYIPQPAAETVEAEARAPSDAVEAEEIAPARQEPKKSRYDFFTVLPEMEVVVPEADLNERSRAQTRAESAQDAGTTAPPPTAGDDQYLLQVGSFRLTGKRIFRMSPLHHHFELIGWKEPQIIIRFWIVAIMFALFSLTTLKLR